MISRRSLFAALTGLVAATKAKAFFVKSAPPLAEVVANLPKSKAKPAVEWDENDYFSRWVRVEEIRADGEFLVSWGGLAIGDILAIALPASYLAPILVRVTWISPVDLAVRLKPLYGTEMPVHVGTALRYIGNKEMVDA